MVLTYPTGIHIQALVGLRLLPWPRAVAVWELAGWDSVTAVLLGCDRGVTGLRLAVTPRRVQPPTGAAPGQGTACTTNHTGRPFHARATLRLPSGGSQRRQWWAAAAPHPTADTRRSTYIHDVCSVIIEHMINEPPFCHGTITCHGTKCTALSGVSGCRRRRRRRHRRQYRPGSYHSLDGLLREISTWRGSNGPCSVQLQPVRLAMPVRRWSGRGARRAGPDRPSAPRRPDAGVCDVCEVCSGCHSRQLYHPSPLTTVCRVKTCCF